MISLTEKLLGIYRESCDIGLNVSLPVSDRNGAETCVFKSVPTGAAVLNAHGRRWRGKGQGGWERHEQREQNGRKAGTECWRKQFKC